jgi:hypothetical protein
MQPCMSQKVDFPRLYLVGRCWETSSPTPGKRRLEFFQRITTWNDQLVTK